MHQYQIYICKHRELKYPLTLSIICDTMGLVSKEDWESDEPSSLASRIHPEATVRSAQSDFRRTGANYSVPWQFGNTSKHKKRTESLPGYTTWIVLTGISLHGFTAYAEQILCVLSNQADISRPCSKIIQYKSITLSLRFAWRFSSHLEQSGWPKPMRRNGWKPGIKRTALMLDISPSVMAICSHIQSFSYDFWSSYFSHSLFWTYIACITCVPGGERLFPFGQL